MNPQMRSMPGPRTHLSFLAQSPPPSYPRDTLAWKRQHTQTQHQALDHCVRHTRRQRQQQTHRQYRGRMKTSQKTEMVTGGETRRNVNNYNPVELLTCVPRVLSMQLRACSAYALRSKCSPLSWRGLLRVRDQDLDCHP